MEITNESTLTDIASAVHRLAKEKGWHDKPETRDQYIERCTNNLHDEVSELHTSWRENRADQPCDKAEKMKELGIAELTSIEEEFADIIIRVCDDCMFLGINPARIVAIKHAFNSTRPYRHGNKRS